MTILNSMVKQNVGRRSDLSDRNNGQTPPTLFTLNIWPRSTRFSHCHKKLAFFLNKRQFKVLQSRGSTKLWNTSPYCHWPGNPQTSCSVPTCEPIFHFKWHVHQHTMRIFDAFHVTCCYIANSRLNVMVCPGRHSNHFSCPCTLFISTIVDTLLSTYI